VAEEGRRESLTVGIVCGEWVRRRRQPLPPSKPTTRTHPPTHALLRLHEAGGLSHVNFGDGVEAGLVRLADLCEGWEGGCVGGGGVRWCRAQSARATVQSHGSKQLTNARKRPRDAAEQSHVGIAKTGKRLRAPAPPPNWVVGVVVVDAHLPTSNALSMVWSAASKSFCVICTAAMLLRKDELVPSSSMASWYLAASQAKGQTRGGTHSFVTVGWRRRSARLPSQAVSLRQYYYEDAKCTARLPRNGNRP
jgi:hypothetical protein